MVYSQVVKSYLTSVRSSFFPFQHNQRQTSSRERTQELSRERVYKHQTNRKVNTVTNYDDYPFIKHVGPV